MHVVLCVCSAHANCTASSYLHIFCQHFIIYFADILMYLFMSCFISSSFHCLFQQFIPSLTMFMYYNDSLVCSSQWSQLALNIYVVIPYKFPINIPILFLVICVAMNDKESLYLMVICKYLYVALIFELNIDCIVYNLYIYVELVI